MHRASLGAVLLVVGLLIGGYVTRATGQAVGIAVQQPWPPRPESIVNLSSSRIGAVLQPFQVHSVFQVPAGFYLVITGAHIGPAGVGFDLLEVGPGGNHVKIHDLVSSGTRDAFISGLTFGPGTVVALQSQYSEPFSFHWNLDGYLSPVAP